MKVWEAFDLFSSLIPGGKDWHKLMKEWGLGHKKDAFFGKLSGGEKQRLFVALALLNDPEVVFLDEMTTGLDPSARRMAWDLVRKIRDAGTTVVLVTHFMEEAENLCDRVAIVEGGKIIATGSPQDLINTHARTVTVTFSANIEDASWIKGVPHVGSVKKRAGAFEVVGDGQVLFHLACALKEHGIVPSDLRVKQPTLEDIYLTITHKPKDKGGD
jgi:ABC-2 type transport system ATP-binding protein